MPPVITVEPTVNRETSVVESPFAKELAEVSALMDSDAWKKIDDIEGMLATLPEPDMPLKHVFTPGLYSREIFMPKGAMVTSRIHLTEHPFVISAGVVSVWDDENGWITRRAPYSGVTKPGTRRILFIHEDTVWTTFHVTSETDPDVIVRELTYSGGKFQELGPASAVPQKRTPPPLDNNQPKELIA